MNWEQIKIKHFQIANYYTGVGQHKIKPDDILKTKQEVQKTWIEFIDLLMLPKDLSFESDVKTNKYLLSGNLQARNQNS